MVSIELIKYLQEFAATGRPLEEARKELVSAGWDAVEVDAAIEEIGSPRPVAVAPVGESLKPTMHESGSGRRSRKLLVFIVAIFVILGASGAAGYYYYYLPSSSSGSPDEILYEAIDNFLAAETFSSEGGFSILYEGEYASGIAPFFEVQGLDVETSNNSRVSFSTLAKGRVDKGDLENIISDVEANFRLEIPGLPQLSTDFNSRTFGTVSFLKINRVEGLDFILDAFLAADDTGGSDFAANPFSGLDSLIGQWIKIDPEEFNSFGDLSWLQSLVPKAGLGSGLPGGMGAVDYNKTLALVSFPGMVPSAGFLGESLDGMGEIFKKHRFLKVATELPEEEIGGEASSHYRLGVNLTELKTAAVEIQVVLMSSFARQFGGELPTDEEVARFREETSLEVDEGFEELLTAFREYVDKAELDVWIGKESGLLTKISLDSEVIHEAIRGRAELALDVYYSNYGDPVIIETPADARDFMEIMELISGSLAE